MEKKKVLLSVRDLHIKFRVRGRILTAIRGVSLDIYEDETLAIVGESGCGKSVLTKSFSGTLDNNGFIDQGEILFGDKELASTSATAGRAANTVMAWVEKKLNAYSKFEPGAETYKKMHTLERERQGRRTLDGEENETFETRRKELMFNRAEASNLRQTLDSAKETAQYKETAKTVAAYDAQIKALDEQKRRTVQTRTRAARRDAAYEKEYREETAALRARYRRECAAPVSGETEKRNKLLAKEIYLSVSRYPGHKRAGLYRALLAAFKKAMLFGVDLRDETQLNPIFETAVFRVKYLNETGTHMHGVLNLNLARTDLVNNWTDIRGNKIAIIFQDPMTSLNPILTIGSQIASIIIKHQHVSPTEAKKRAIVLMKKVGIPNAENRFDDYPFQYSGGMRQRIVIAIALSCQPKILICDEPTTALDVTIQAQILQLIRELQKEFHYTTVFITHDLGVVANVADRVAVIYAGQIIEIGTAEEVFYDPRHPYTWVLLSSLPQLSDRGRELYSIAGTPPSLYNRIIGDAFSPRNPYCLRVDTLKEPPMFKVTDTHYAKTWLLDPRAPKIEKPANICDINGRLKKVFNITGD